MFRIRWPKSVSRKLLAAIAKGDSDLQTAILGAMGDIEWSLRNEPEFVGESRGADEGLLIVEPLRRVQDRSPTTYRANPPPQSAPFEELNTWLIILWPKPEFAASAAPSQKKKR